MKTMVFVRINRYKEVENTINEIKKKMQEARDIIGKINQFKVEEENELNVWSDDIQKIEDQIKLIEEAMVR
jgi:uncharacterized protein YajQ (UPF0234 family)